MLSSRVWLWYSTWRETHHPTLGGMHAHRGILTPLVAAAVLAASLSAPALGARIETTPADFQQPGTQPSAVEFNDFELPSPDCSNCHGNFDSSIDAEISDGWASSMMAQAARDPLTRAAAAIANDDAAGSAETCIRCHSPVGWLGGRSSNADFDDLVAGDLHGVTCHMCHRMLDPIARADAPSADAAVLSALTGASVRPGGTCAGTGAACASDAACGVNGPCQVDAGQGRFVVDPDPLPRRGPREFLFHPGHQVMTSPFHARSEACAPCHDVSTPTYTRDGDDTYTLNALAAAHPTQDPDDMFPEQRTYSEWRASDFAEGGVVFPDGRFGGTKTATLPNTVPVSTCQDCHMADVAMQACSQGEARTDAAGHFFTGANTWVLGAVLDEYGASSGLTTASVAAAATRTRAMLEAASDLEVTQDGSTLTVRVVNQSGHKLPTGYPEGRRMWLTVRFFAGDDPTPIAEHGAYDPATAELDLSSAKIYEAHQVLDATTAAATGLEPGTPFHLVLSNAIELDNRIPPRGFTNAAFAKFGGAPVGADYADGQHWDDTIYTIPPDATRVDVELRYQSTSKEYIEFLRDNGGEAGENAHARWVARGRSAPVTMDRVLQDLVPLCTPPDAPCEDGDPCTTSDTCGAGGACEPGTQVACADDGNACTDDVCDSSTGACGVPRAGACDDGDACTTGDTCNAGQCGGDAVGFEGLRCLLTSLQSAQPCGAPLPKKVANTLRKRARKAGALATKAEKKQSAGAKEKIVGKLLNGATKSLAAIDAQATRAVSARKDAQRITQECADAVRALTARPQALLAQLAP